MYYLNRILIERLPKLFRISRKELCRQLGVEYRQFNKWVSGKYMSVDMLINLSNHTRISLAEFLVVSETPVQRASVESYVTPAEKWVPVSWRREAILELFGDKGKLGVSMWNAAKQLDISNSLYLERWADPNVKVDLFKLLKLFNEFHLDATLFFEDNNCSIPVPIWDIEDKHIAGILKDKLDQFRSLEIGKRKSNRIMTEYKVENERLKRDMKSLKRSKDNAPVSSGLVLETPVTYRPIGQKVEWAFNMDLWKALPDMFELTKSEFCDRSGFSRMAEYYITDNARISVLLQVCNEFRISISHFFIRKGTKPVIHDRAYYEMSRHVFRPIEGRLDALNYLFGRWSVFGYSTSELNQRTGLSYVGLKSASDKERSRVITLADICSEFSLSPMLFFDDPNRKDDGEIYNRYERLILNAIDMRKEIMELRAANKRLKQQLNKGSDADEQQ